MALWDIKILLSPSVLRNILGTRNLGDILSERESIATEMKQTLDEATDPWGVQVWFGDWSFVKNSK